MASSEGIALTEHGRTQASGHEESGQSGLHSRTLPLGQAEHEQVSLPRVDGGRRAWLFLAGSFMIEALIWGITNCPRGCTLR